MGELINDIRQVLGVGKKLWLFYGSGSINNREYEVRAVVDGEWVVLKINEETYKLEHISYLQMQAKKGYLQTIE